MGGLLMLITLCVVMALASFFAGALPLSITLSQSQLRLVSSIGIGILVGTSLVVIIPEGIEAVAASVDLSHAHSHGARSVSVVSVWSGATIAPRGTDGGPPEIRWRAEDDSAVDGFVHRLASVQQDQARDSAEDEGLEDQDPTDKEGPRPQPEGASTTSPGEGHGDMPTFDIGFSLILGFALMFLIDRLPRHATEKFRATPQPRHISLDSLGRDNTHSEADDEGDSFLGSLAPSPRHARSLATTVGLVIHAVTDGIAMGASSTAADTKLGLIVFIAIMIHKAPVSFGLTSVLLSHGLSKRVARGHLIVFSLAAPAGALTTWFIIRVLGGASLEGESGQWWTGMLLLFSAGTFLYVAMHAMQEDSGNHSHGYGHGHGHLSGSLNGYGDINQGGQFKRQAPQVRDTLATVGGMLLPLLTQIGHSHGH